jgi:ubiquinone/menaquinone biosynthesis C-methylase UbiE
MRDVFDRIAPGWYNFRHWSIFRTELEDLAQRWQKGRLLNVGCGHGPDFLPFTDGFELHGLDFSGEMLKLARKYAGKFKFQANLVQADVRNLPYKDQSFDWAIAVATYHHLQKREDQLNALRELRRVLKPGGEALVTVWNRWQPSFWLKGRQTYVPWRTGETTLYRYYYLFTYGGLEKLVKKAGFKVLRSFPEYRYRFPLKYYSRNICLLIKKV